MLLAGDIRFELNNRGRDAEEQAFLDELGTVARVANLRSMARLDDGSDQALVEAEGRRCGLSALWQRSSPSRRHARRALLGESMAVSLARAAPLLFERLGIKTGDAIMLGTATFELRGNIVREPDAAVRRFWLCAAADGVA